VPIIAILVNLLVGQATIIGPTAVVLGTTAVVSDDKAMDHYLATRGDK
jgi:hypothetical protein